jgi:citrate/tricarballylate utilization protein
LVELQEERRLAMPTLEVLKKAEQEMVICNACRYCEGFCAVFPAMELRTKFEKGDLVHLANLCFDCRACYYACQFAPPHEWGINVPKSFAQIRADTYREYSWPGIFAKLFGKNGPGITWITLAATAIIFGLVILSQGLPAFLGVHVGEGAFYRVVPYLAMVLPASVILIYAFVVFALGANRFWKDTRGSLGQMVNLGALMKASSDAFGLKYMTGGGYGCNYPSEAFSKSRRVYHQLVVYGFLLDLASTTLAAIYDHFLGSPAPYPVLHPVVVLGTLGGIGLVIGCGGLLSLKWKSDRDPADATMFDMDVAFLWLLLGTAVTGLALLVLRETSLMGSLLVVHLGIVAGLFLTFPYGKFAHVVYRYAALVRNAIEMERAEAVGSSH